MCDFSYWSMEEKCAQVPITIGFFVVWSNPLSPLGPKTYESDYFTGKQSPNNGKPDQYMIEGHHEGLVDKKRNFLRKTLLFN